MFRTREYRQYEIKQREFETHGRLKNEILLVKLFIRLFCNEAFFHQLLHSSSMAINFRNRMNVLANYEVNGLAYNIRHVYVYRFVSKLSRRKVTGLFPELLL